MQYIYFAASVILNIIYSCAYLIRYTKKLEVKKAFKTKVVLFIIFSCIPLYNNDFVEGYYEFRALLVLFINFLLIASIFKGSLTTKLYLYLNYYIYVYIGFMFYSSLILRINQLPMNIVSVNLGRYYEASYFLSYLTALIIFYILNKKYNKKKVYLILKNKKILSLMILIQAIFIINSTLYVLDNQSVFNESLSSIVTMIIFSFYLAYLIIYILVINVSYLSTYKLLSKVLEGQLELQIDHYRSYDEHMKSIFKFKHDYQKILNALMIINQKAENPQITNVINSSFEEMQSIDEIYKKYSDNFLVDALLNHYAAKLKLLDVSLSDDFKLPIRFQLNEYETIKLFSNILENIVEALTEVPINKRELSIQTSLIEGYQVIIFKNSTSTKYKVFTTKKADRIKHGYGLHIIQEIIDNNNGFISLKYEEENNTRYFVLKMAL